MRLITRSDFDGLVCAVFLKEAGIIDHCKFAHPKDLQDGLITVTQNDCLANTPYVEGCGLWFDHHASEDERLAYAGKFTGDSRPCPSAAHIIYDYYGGREKFPRYADLLAAVDKVDSANLTREEILRPAGWILLGFIMDPRTGLGRFHEFRASNYQLMENMIDWLREKPIEEIMALPDVVERVNMYTEQSDKFTDMVKRHTVTHEQVIVSDLRGVDPIYSGNRFQIYSLYPEQNISVWIVSLRGGEGCSAAVGHSILNRTSKVNVGRLMLKYGGGGHRQVGTCQFTNDTMDARLAGLIAEIRALNE
jgi:nanoRNase/pAp phosphatase (c-di-AMP/oligoRNAs hydrolase)